MEWGRLQRRCARAVGRPARKRVVCYHEFMYWAESWDRERRVVGTIRCHQGELI